MSMCSDASSTRATGRPRSNVTGSSPRLHRQPQAGRGAARSCARPRRRPPRPRPAAGPTAPGGPCAARSARGAWRAASRAAPRSSSAQSSLESRKVWTSRRVRHVLGGVPAVRRRTPPPALAHRVVAARSSGKWEKNCHGVRAPHSSPMNSIGVNGEQTAAPRRTRRARGERAAEPVAGRPVADLVVVLQVGDEPVAGDPAGVDRRAVVAAAEAATRCRRAGTPGSCTCASPVEPGGREVGVVALVLAGQRGVQAVVDVVVPLRVQPVAAAVAGRDQPRVVEVRLGDQRQRPAEVRGQRLDLDRSSAPAGAWRGGRAARARRRGAARRRGSRAATSARCR